jgi:hypothetical protein
MNLVNMKETLKAKAFTSAFPHLMRIAGMIGAK